MIQGLAARSRWLFGLAVLALAILAGAAAVRQVGAVKPSGEAPGAPGEKAVWTEADKDGFGTSTTTSSKVWYTLDDGELTEVYYPDLGTPSVRDLQFIVSDGKTFAELETDATTHEVQLVDERALEYRQINTDKDGNYRVTKTYVTDPARSTLLVDVGFESLTGEPYQLYVLYDPSLKNGGNEDSGFVRNAALRAHSLLRRLWARAPPVSKVLATAGRTSRTTTG
jgi:glucoamylase